MGCHFGRDLSEATHQTLAEEMSVADASSDASEVLERWTQAEVVLVVADAIWEASYPAPSSSSWSDMSRGGRSLGRKF